MTILCHLCMTRRRMKKPTEALDAAVAHTVTINDIVDQKFAFT